MIKCKVVASIMSLVILGFQLASEWSQDVVSISTVSLVMWCSRLDVGNLQPVEADLEILPGSLVVDLKWPRLEHAKVIYRSNQRHQSDLGST